MLERSDKAQPINRGASSFSGNLLTATTGILLASQAAAAACEVM
jgi:hypothetical protein